MYGFCAGDEQPNVTLTYPDASRVSSQTPQGAVSKMFSVGSSQGELSLLFRPDREIASEYRFSVCVTDRSETPQTALTDVRVTIQDTNDCQPQFEHSNYEFFVQVRRGLGFPVRSNALLKLAPSSVNLQAADRGLGMSGEFVCGCI